MTQREVQQKLGPPIESGRRQRMRYSTYSPGKSEDTVTVFFGEDERVKRIIGPLVNVPGRGTLSAGDTVEFVEKAIGPPDKISVDPEHHSGKFFVYVSLRLSICFWPEYGKGRRVVYFRLE